MTRYEALEKLLELAEKFRSGKWMIVSDWNRYAVMEENHPHERFVCTFNQKPVSMQGRKIDPVEYCGADRTTAEFIVAAKNAIPELRALLADVREREAVAWGLKGPLGLAATLFFTEDAAKEHESKVLHPIALYTSPPSQQAVDVGEIRKEVETALSYLRYHEISSRECPRCGNSDDCKDDDVMMTRKPLQHALELLGKHLVSPREGWVMVKKDLLNEAAQRLVSAPDDWVLVPREPTQAMLDAGMHEASKHSVAYSQRAWLWKQMLSASPPLAPTVGEK